MDKIIVPIDFSRQSENALKTAVSIAKRENSEIIVVHMLELPEGLTTQSESFSKEQTVFYIKLAEKKIQDFLSKDYLQGVKLTPIIKHHKIFSELSQIVEEEKVKLIVMGSRGIPGLDEILIGSNTEKVVRNSEIPVLVVKEEPIKSFKKAVLACDFSDEYIETYKEAVKLLQKLGCELELLYVNTPHFNFTSTKERKEKVINFLQQADGDLNNLKNVVYVSDYTVEEGILEYSKSNEMDLIVMTTHARKGFSRIFNGSISEGVVNHSTLPVITFKIS